MPWLTEVVQQVNEDVKCVAETSESMYNSIGPAMFISSTKHSSTHCLYNYTVMGVFSSVYMAAAICPAKHMQ